MATTTATEGSVRPEVRRGAALLDEQLPGWDRLIDLARLDLNYCDKCVVGQLWGYDDGLDELGLLSPRETTDHGFDLEGVIDDASYAKLTEEWRDLIAERRMT